MLIRNFHNSKLFYFANANGFANSIPYIAVFLFLYLLIYFSLILYSCISEFEFAYCILQTPIFQLLPYFYKVPI